MDPTPMPPKPPQGSAHPSGAPRAFASRAGALRRAWKAILAFVIGLCAVVFAAVLVLPFASGVQGLQHLLTWLSPLFALVYGVCLVLVWTRGVAFIHWLARKRGVAQPPLQAARAARNALTALLLVMELTVLLHWLGGSPR